MDRMIKTGFFAGLILLLTGCVSYTTVELDVLKPADTQFPVEIASVVVVDNAYPFRATDTTVHEVDLPDSTFTIDTVWVDEFDSLAVQAMGEALEARQFFDSVHVAKKSFNTEEDGKPMRPLEASVVDSLCRHYNAQAVISLDHYDYGTTLEVVAFYDNYMATLDARSSTYWKIYDHVNGELLDVQLQNDTIFWDYVERDISRAVSGIPSTREALKDAAVHAGERYAGYVAPTWTKEERVMFKQGHPLFPRAASLANRGEWEQAGRMWYHVYEENSGKVKARAAFNLALSKEVLGEFREAAAWGYQALEEYEDLGSLAVSQPEKETAKEFYLNLATRIQEKKKLDEQYGVDE
ncbi:MAG: DUF6340 family protein [Marinilabiliaceae bacterium]